MIKKEIERKELKQVLHFRFSFEPRFSEVDKSLFLALPLRTTSCNVHYSGPIWQWKRDLEQVYGNSCHDDDSDDDDGGDNGTGDNGTGDCGNHV